MRILGNIDQMGMKITVFSNENRISIKFERDGLEQTYKFRDDDNMRTLQHATALVNEDFCRSVAQQFGELARIRYFGWQRYLPEQEGEFEVII